MTTTIRPPTAPDSPGAAPPPPAPVAAPPKPKRSRRWLRVVIPFAVVVAVITGTVVVHTLQQPDATDAAFLSPISRDGIGAAALADRLAARGVVVERVTKASDALVSANHGDATLFIPAPGLVNQVYLRMIKLLPDSVRVVLVEPAALTLDRALIPVQGTKTRWAPEPVPPGCGWPEAAAAGPAGVFHVAYGEVPEESARCYGGALVAARYLPAELVLVGSSEPFRNDRATEYGNAALATGLLGAHKRIVWLDLHHGEPAPGLIDRSPDAGAGAPPSLSTGGSPDPDFPVADPNGPQRGQPQPGGGIPRQDARGGGGEPPPTPYWKLLPLWAWLALGLLALAALLFALAQARRLGPPVSEPLPVAVRAAETVEGRGRLYRRGKARSAALAALRTAALARLRTALDLAKDAPAPVVVAEVAARTGWDPARIDAVLYGAEPGDDAELVHLTNEIDALLHLAVDVHEGVPR
jgi:hypothetical protein